MIATPKTAMVLAAGLGTRLRPITQTLPKPLVEIAGRTLLDRAIDRLVAVGVERVVVNLHYLPDLIERQLGKRRDLEIRLSHEPELLETGGGIKQALPLLDDQFYVVNADVLWLDGKIPALQRLAGAFQAERHDAVQCTVQRGLIEIPDQHRVRAVALNAEVGELFTVRPV